MKTLILLCLCLMKVLSKHSNKFKNKMLKSRTKEGDNPE